MIREIILPPRVLMGREGGWGWGGGIGRRMLGCPRFVTRFTR